ncbi:MAG: DUF4372 domain-containing protein [Fibrobacter sp.]|nr:DUF4372 domain-containing protein [Fibrobacter sp.]
MPAYLVPKIARKHGVDKKVRTYSPWSLVVSMILGQLTHALYVIFIRGIVHYPQCNTAKP